MANENNFADRNIYKSRWSEDNHAFVLFSALDAELYTYQYLERVRVGNQCTAYDK